MKNPHNSRTAISRRSFVQSSLYAAAGVGLLSTVPSTMATAKAHNFKQASSKRDMVLSVLDMSMANKYVPAAFFMHFGENYKEGQAAIDRHLEYFRATDMDFVKIQYELGMPRVELKKPADWKKVPVYKKDFFQPALNVIAGIVKSAKAEALIIPTVYSPFMCAAQIAGGKRILLQHINEDPGAVAQGMQRVTESVMNYVKESIKLGVDGFYLSTQGGEVNRIPKAALFDKLVRPFDMEVMTLADKKCAFNILHICDYEGKYASLERYVSYPGKVVNTPIALADGKPVTTKDAATLFKRPVMGGLNRLGTIARGTPEEIAEAVDETMADAPSNFILGADCTVPNTVNWETLRSVIRQAHTYRNVH
ncbi:MAG: hypothetical protein LBL24_05260 [Bacteroidales bacterium]|jgi:uroporphyrinogen decarboxylase|nr:hypothetical protein [Bacteroidales bacterium]